MSRNSIKGREFRPYGEAKTFAHTLGLKSSREWREWCKSGEKPNDIPANPARTYKQQWQGWGDWLGTGYTSPADRTYKSFTEARVYSHALHLNNTDKWFEYCRTGNKPDDVPANPNVVYEEEWIGWPDWLGYEERKWSLRKVKKLLKGWIESGMIYDEDDLTLFDLLHVNGLLHLDPENRHEKFFKNLIEARHSPEGLDAIKKYVNSDLDIPPEFEESEEIETANSEEIAKMVESEVNPLDYGKLHTVEEILKQSERLESYSEDSENMQFHVNRHIKRLWPNAFRDPEATYLKVKAGTKTGNKYRDEIREIFLTDYEASTRIKLPGGYSFRDEDNQILEPTLMQKYVTYKVKSNHRFGNFSGTGAGKTLSAILASRVIDSHLAVIICPNAVVDQWAKDIKRTFPDSVIQKRKEAFYEKYDENKHKYLIINYDLFSQPYSPNLVLKLVEQRIDFVVLDEIHFTKKREKTGESKRRHIIEGMMSEVTNKNPDVYVLGLSATPVINGLEEGKSLLELITHKKYDDISTRPITLYKKLSLISIREIPQYPVILPKDVIVEVDIRKYDIDIKKLKNNPLGVELLTIDAKIPEIIRHIQGPTIIYTQYVTGIIAKLRSAVQAAGYSCAEYTGDDHSGLDIFKNKKVQVLIASHPISVGVDGLQHICNNLIINTLPWTNAGYQQLVGRLIRKGGRTDSVDIFVIKAKFVDQISDKEFEYDENKWTRILNKRTLADCAVDGILPWKNMVTPNQALMEAVKWLERMVRGEISTVVRRDLYVELTPVEIKKRIKKYGDFTRLNNQINNENSETTHNRMLSDPGEWEEYHRQYREARKGWSIIPYDEIIKRIKQSFTSRMLTTLQIGDFGCGEAKIMEAFGSERVYSLDHIAVNNKVTACDMKNVGLPDDVLDVAVFSLSLMGRNWSDYIGEAKRCLAMNGYLLIAETTKSLSTRLADLTEILKEQGFEIYREEERGDFTFIEAREVWH